MPDITGKVAVVTGAGRGLGRAFALRLSAVGMMVALADCSSEGLNETLGMLPATKAVAIDTDISNREAVTRLISKTEHTLGPIDLLINNAGVSGPLGPLWQTDTDAWWRCQEVNLKGAVLCCHAVLPGMISRNRGRIINIASGAGAMAVPHMSAYVTSKAALIRFTETLAAEVQPHGIAVFAIHPGVVRTPMNEELMASAESSKWIPWLEGMFKAGQDNTTQASTDLALYLASGKADTLSGRFFSVPQDPEDLVRNAEEIRAKGLYTLRLRQE